MGLFAAKRFKMGDIITIYFAPNKNKTPPKFTKYAIQRYGYYFSVREGCPCKEKDRERLEKQNNAVLEGFTVKAKYRILPGCEIKLSYNGE